MAIHSPLSITGLGALSALGSDVASHHRAVLAGQVPFQSLGKLLGGDSPHALRPAAWIEPRSLLIHRKWSPATMAALHVARQAIAEAGWTAEGRVVACLQVGRGITAADVCMAHQAGHNCGGCGVFLSAASPRGGY